ncbi:pyridoxal phosphate-dependent aminotransferase [Pseudophaeobacter sp.]|uniref:pyridoxal phosphate-dependent aminotransferase n=1 Tax=Pseudophaeobacter sp. TaxID=1971739 RepID=UPI0025D4C91A|nr:pyridoxal phosphate-dependent aminotransferase [uncultured Pseudophaeobacter sp.]
MKTTDVTARLASLGGAKWDLHLAARDRIAAGADIIEMTIGEPDVPVPAELMDHSIASMRAGRTGYSDGRGELNLRRALAESYSNSRGREFEPDNFLCFPGTQTALFAAMMGVAQHGDEVLVGDPMYATYEGVVAASGAKMVPVPLKPENGFRMQAADVASRITPRTRALLLTSPHNPTGAILRQSDLLALCELARIHDFWILSDEVYEQLVFDGAEFVSPLSLPDYADRVIAVSSISKSHASPGFRSGWAVGSKAFCDALLPYSETMLFGNQPFIADMTELAIREGSSVSSGMRQRFSRRAQLLADRVEAETALQVHRPEAGMFAMINVAATGLTGDAYAWDLLENGVAVMPGSAFSDSLTSWVRVALTIEDAEFETALNRLISHTQSLTRGVA